MKLLGTLVLMSCFALAACSTYPKTTNKYDSMTRSLSDPQRAAIDQARVEYDRCGDKLAEARQEVVRAKAQLTVAKKDLTVMEAQIDKTQAEVAVAKMGTQGDLAAASEKLHLMKAKVQAQENLIHLRECEVKQCEKSEVLADRVQAQAAANVELEKARAFSMTNLAASTEVDVPKWEAEVRESQTQVSHAKVELEAAERECGVAQRAFELATAESK